MDLLPLMDVALPLTEEKDKGKGKEVLVTEGIQPVVKIIKRVNNNEFVDFTDLLQDQFSYEHDLSIQKPNRPGACAFVGGAEAQEEDNRLRAEALMVFVAIKLRNSNPEVSDIMVVLSQMAREHQVERWLMCDRKYQAQERN